MENVKTFVRDKQTIIKYSLICLAAALVIVFLCAFFFGTHEVYANVTSFYWERNITVEEYKTLHEGGWSVPSGGRQTGNEIRKSGDKKVHDGYRTEYYTTTCYRTESQMDTCYRSVYHSRSCMEDNGNGSFSSYECGSSSSESYSCSKIVTVPYPCQESRQVEVYHYEPVYSTWYFYDIERWVSIANYPTKGNNHEPYYDKSYQIVDDKHRLKQGGEKYIVYFINDEVGTFQKEYDLETWSSFSYESKVKVTTNFLKVILKVEP